MHHPQALSAYPGGYLTSRGHTAALQTHPNPKPPPIAVWAPNSWYPVLVVRDDCPAPVRRNKIGRRRPYRCFPRCSRFGPKVRARVLYCLPAVAPVYTNLQRNQGLKPAERRPSGPTEAATCLELGPESKTQQAFTACGAWGYAAAMKSIPAAIRTRNLRLRRRVPIAPKSKRP
jgi:hypothetical protein